MRKLHTLILSGHLTPHEFTPTDIISAIKALQPTVIKDDMQGDISLVDIHSVHQINNYSIERIICYLRETHFQVDDIDDIFTSGSAISQACIALSQMEKVKLLNNFYLNKLNLPGLNEVNDSLGSLFHRLEKR